MQKSSSSYNSYGKALFKGMKNMMLRGVGASGSSGSSKAKQTAAASAKVEKSTSPSAAQTRSLQEPASSSASSKSTRLTSAFEEQKKPDCSLATNPVQVKVSTVDNDTIQVGTEEEDKDGGSPRQVTAPEAINDKIKTSPPSLEISSFDEEMVKRAIQMKPRSLSFVLDQSTSSPPQASIEQNQTNYRLDQNDIISPQLPS